MTPIDPDGNVRCERCGRGVTIFRRIGYLYSVAECRNPPCGWSWFVNHHAFHALAECDECDAAGGVLAFRVFS